MTRAPSIHRTRGLFVALLLSLLLWQLPIGNLVMYPFKLFATWLHEMSHGIAMIVTGAGFEYLNIFRDTSGLAQARDSVGPFGRAAIASAGYLGTSVAGGLILAFGQTQRGARGVLLGLSAALGVSVLLWLQNDFGRYAMAIASALFLFVALLGKDISIWVINLVGAQSCIHALLDIRVLFRPEMVINGRAAATSDAHNMAMATFGNHWLWACIWLAVSLFAFYVALRWVYLHAQQSPETNEAQKTNPTSA